MVSACSKDEPLADKYYLVDMNIEGVTYETNNGINEVASPSCGVEFTLEGTGKWAKYAYVSALYILVENEEIGTDYELNATTENLVPYDSEVLCIEYADEKAPCKINVTLKENTSGNHRAIHVIFGDVHHHRTIIIKQD